MPVILCVDAVHPAAEEVVHGIKQRDTGKDQKAAGAATAGDSIGIAGGVIAGGSAAAGSVAP